MAVHGKLQLPKCRDQLVSGARPLPLASGGAEATISQRALRCFRADCFQAVRICGAMPIAVISDAAHCPQFEKSAEW